MHHALSLSIIRGRGDVVTRFILLLSADAYAKQLCKQGLKIGEGAGIVYAYGYRCCQDRIKFGSTDVDTVERIAQQINMSTPDKPVLLIEIRTNKCRALERAIQATLETRGCKVTGGGAEWFKASRDEILAIYQFINQS